jgi:hypothetical protein
MYINWGKFQHIQNEWKGILINLCFKIRNYQGGCIEIRKHDKHPQQTKLLYFGIIFPL